MNEQTGAPVDNMHDRSIFVSKNVVILHSQSDQITAIAPTLIKPMIHSI
jgi:hypothetical protein